MRAFGCLLALLLCVSQAAGQIVVEDHYRLGEPIIFEVALPEGGRAAWRADAGATVIEFAPGKAYGWAEPGKHAVQAVVVAVKDGQLDALAWHEATYTVGGTPPEPQPPGPSPPDPTPPGPTPPGPTPPGPVPDDRWGVGQLTHSLVASLDGAVKAQAQQTALIFEASAARLLGGEATTINKELIRLKEERQKLWGANAAKWGPFVDAINLKFSESWPMTKADIAEFLKAIAGGLKAVQ